MNPMSSVPSTARPDSAGRPQVLTAPASLPRDVDTRRVLRNTYALLSMTLLFSASIAAASATLQLPAPSLLLTLGGYFGLLFAVYKFKNSGLALPAVFALTGFMGYSLGPVLAQSLALPGGAQVVTLALAATGATFLALSAWVLTSRRDFGFMGAGCIHPGQVTIVNEEYKPSAAEVEYARKVIAMDKEAAAAGRGSFALDGKMIDIPIIVRAERLLKRFEAITAREAQTLAAMK